MLSVGVKGDHNLCPEPLSRVESSLKRGALSAVDRVANYGRTGLSRPRGGIVVRSVVDHQDQAGRSFAAKFLDDRGDHRAFIEGWHHVHYVGA